MTPYHPNLDDLEIGLTERGEETRAEIVARLRSHGVDTTAFFDRLDNVVQAAESKRQRTIVEREMRELHVIPPFLRGVATRSFEDVKTLFAQITQGTFGDRYRQLAIARCREKSAGDFTENELKSWLEDLTDIIRSEHPQ